MAERPEVMDPAYIEAHFGELLVEGLQQALAFERGDESVARVVVLTARDTAIEPPPAIDRARIVQIRERLQMSPRVFAEALNVSSGTVAAWEQGDRQPSGAALRLLEVAATAPEWFLSHVREPARARRA